MCLGLLDAKEELPFIWDTSIYTNPGALREARLQGAVGTLIGDTNYQEPGEDYDDDNEATERPNWQLGEVRVIRLASPPFWAMARLELIVFSLFVLLLFFSFILKTDCLLYFSILGL